MRTLLLSSILLRSILLLSIVSGLFLSHLMAQEPTPSNQMPDMPSSQAYDMQDMPGMHGHMESHSLIESLENHTTAGTDAEPNSTPTHMLMTTRGNWQFMFHGVAFLGEIQQSGPRGAGKLFSTNWLMPMAQRKVGNGTLTLRAMLSLEPATISRQRYPELFQQGETAFGRPIVDGQHPHDFFMELAAMYDYKIGENTLLSFYAAPRGDPALGPVAFPHRSSASENPAAPLRIPRILWMMLSQLGLPTVLSGWKPPAFMAGNRTNSAGI